MHCLPISSVCSSSRLHKPFTDHNCRADSVSATCGAQLSLADQSVHVQTALPSKRTQSSHKHLCRIAGPASATTSCRTTSILGTRGRRWTLRWRQAIRCASGWRTPPPARCRPSTSLVSSVVRRLYSCYGIVIDRWLKYTERSTSHWRLQVLMQSMVSNGFWMQCPKVSSTA